MRTSPLVAIFPLLGMCKAIVFLSEGMMRLARVACRPFEQLELYLELSIGEEEMRALLPCLVPGRGQPLFPFRLPSPLAWQSPSVESLYVVLWDSAFDHCDFLGSVAVAVENCQDAWGVVGIIKADRLSVCLPWCSVSLCSHDVCGFK